MATFNRVLNKWKLAHILIKVNIIKKLGLLNQVNLCKILIGIEWMYIIIDDDFYSIVILL